MHEDLTKRRSDSPHWMTASNANQYWLTLCHHFSGATNAILKKRPVNTSGGQQNISLPHKMMHPCKVSLQYLFICVHT